MRFQGTLKTWHEDRGYGAILPDNSAQEVFVHLSAFPTDGRIPEVGERLSFSIEAGADGRKRAVRVVRPGNAVSREERESAWGDLPRGSSVPMPLRDLPRDSQRDSLRESPRDAARPASRPAPLGGGRDAPRASAGSASGKPAAFAPAGRPTAPFRPPPTVRRGRSGWLGWLAVTLILLVLAAGYYFWLQQRGASALPPGETAASEAVAPRPAGRKTPATAGVTDVRKSPKMHCDARTQCRQMSSCAEARFFVLNCPDFEIDGDGDGISCEQEWCAGNPPR